MIRKIVAICAVLLVGMLVGCTTNEDYSSFIGVVTEISENHAIVTPNEDEDIRSSGDAVSIGTLDEYDEDFETGDIIKVTYTGGVMESYPLQVKVINVEKVE